MPVLPVIPVTRINFQRGESPFPQPLQPPGHSYDGQRSEDGSALFEALQQITTITLGGSTATNDVTKLTITPIRGQFGSAWAEQLPPVVVSFTTGATETLAAVAEGLFDALRAAQTITSLADVAAYQRVADFVLPSYDGGTPEDLVLTARDAGGQFGYTLSSTGSVTETSVTDNADPGVLEVGTIGVLESQANGERKIIKITSATPAGAALGLIMEPQAGLAPSLAGYSLHTYTPASDVRWRKYGTATAYAERGVTVGAQAYARRPLSGKITGALTDTPDIFPEVLTITPTAANSTVYSAMLTVRDFWTGVVAAQGVISYTSDGDATPTEIVAGLAASLVLNAAVAALVTASGTTTLILTQDAGYVLDFASTGVGVLAVAETIAASSAHVLVPGTTFTRSTSAEGSCAIQIAHP